MEVDHEKRPDPERVGCSGRPGRPLPSGAPGSAASQTRPASPELAALVPQLAAWTLSEAPRSYFPDNLFEYIDGAAESYLSYDFRELLVADLEKKGTDATLTLEIYDMGLPLNAFGIFAAERYPENKVVALGDLGYLEGEALNFLSGRFYVKMLAFGLGEATESTLGRSGPRSPGRSSPRAGSRRSSGPSPRTTLSPGARSTSKRTSWATSSSTTAMSRPTSRRPRVRGILHRRRVGEGGRGDARQAP